MTRKHAKVIFVTGLLAGVMLTACAGATGGFEVPGSTGALPLGPALDELAAPALDLQPAVVDKTMPAEIHKPMERLTLPGVQTLDSIRSTLQQQAEAVEQVPAKRFCSGEH